MPSSGPLQGLRVLDVCQLAVGPLTAAYLGELGAEVIKVETPSGDPIRRLEPATAENSTYYAAVNANKKSIALDLKNKDERDLVLRMVEDVDVFIENFRPGVMDRLGLGYDSLSSINPGLVYMSCSGYGSRGPRRSEGAGDGFIRMFTGFDTMNGVAGDKWQRFRNLGHVDHVTSGFILEAILAALLVKKTSGIGQLIETSMMQTTMAYQATSIVEYLASGIEPSPTGSAGSWWFPDQAFAAFDGYLAITVRSDEEWKILCDALGIKDEDSVVSLDREGRIAAREDLLPMLESRLCERTVDEWVDLLAGNGVPSSPFLEISEMAVHQQTEANGMVVHLPHAWGMVRLAAPPWEFSDSAATITPAPIMDHHADEIRAAIRERRASDFAVDREDRQVPMEVGQSLRNGTPLAGVRVLEIWSRGWAVSYAGMQLADLGADVVKIEPPTGDPLREVGHPGRENNRYSAIFAELNRTKRSLVVDAQVEADLAMLTAAAAGTDVVLGDFSNGQSQELPSLDYQEVRRSNPRVIYCDVSGFGSRGPWSERPSSELVVQAVSGAWQYLGAEGQAPLRLGIDVAEIAAALNAVQGILAALIYRAETQRGQIVRVSRLRAMVALESHLLAATTNPSATGGWHIPAPRLPVEYPLEAADRPVELSLPDAAAFTELYRALGAPDDLSEDKRFVEKLAIVLHWEEFLAQMGPFVRRWRADDIKAFVEAFGGIAAVGNSYSSLIADPQVEAMNVIARAGKGNAIVGIDPPWEFGFSSLAQRREAPLLGERIGPEVWVPQPRSPKTIAASSTRRN